MRQQENVRLPRGIGIQCAHNSGVRRCRRVASVVTASGRPLCAQHHRQWVFLDVASSLQSEVDRMDSFFAGQGRRGDRVARWDVEKRYGLCRCQREIRTVATGGSAVYVVGLEDTPRLSRRKLKAFQGFADEVVGAIDRAVSSGLLVRPSEWVECIISNWDLRADAGWRGAASGLSIESLSNPDFDDEVPF